MPYADKDKQREWNREWRKRQYHEDPEFAENVKSESAQYRESHPDKVVASKKAWYEANKERIKKERKASRPDRYLKELKRKYGLSKDEYERLLERAGNACEICGTTATLAVDHCHSLNIVRGIVCKHCNTGLGYYRDDPGALRRAADYLERFTRERNVDAVSKTELDGNAERGRFR